MIELGDEVQIITDKNGHGFEYLERGFITSISTDGYYMVESDENGQYEITINDFELI
jgi:hypothetical protein